MSISEAVPFHLNISIVDNEWEEYELNWTLSLCYLHKRFFKFN